MTNKNLFLIVTKYWYDRIASGEKRVEYRENTKYWKNRIFAIHRGFGVKTVELQCGYSRKYERLIFTIEKVDLVMTPYQVKKTIKTEACFAIYFK